RTLLLARLPRAAVRDAGLVCDSPATPVLVRGRPPPSHPRVSDPPPGGPQASSPPPSHPPGVPQPARRAKTARRHLAVRTLAGILSDRYPLFMFMSAA